VAVDKGSFAYRFTKTATSGTSAYVALTTSETTGDMHGLTAGREYTWAARIYVSSTAGPQTTEVRLQIQDYNGSWNVSSGTPTTTVDAYGDVTVTRTLSTDATGVRMRLVILGGASSGESVDVDQYRVYANGLVNESSQAYRDVGALGYAAANSWQSTALI